MSRIAQKVEKDSLFPGILNAQRPESGSDGFGRDLGGSPANRAHAETVGRRLLHTASGTTGLRASRERPDTPVIALSPVIETARRLAIVWGLHCVVTEDAVDLDDMVDRACRIAFREEFAKPGDRIIITAGVPLRTPGATNMLRIAYIGSDGLSGI